MIHILKLRKIEELTVPFCILPVCSQDASPAQPPRRGAGRPTWAMFRDKAICTCKLRAEEVLEVQSRRERGRAACSLEKISVRAVQNSSPASNTRGTGEGSSREREVQGNPTSAGKLRIFFDRQTQLCALWGSPSTPGISLDVGLELHQIDLERAWK